MPRQIQGVQLTDNGDGTVNVQIGPSGYTMDKSVLFNPGWNPDAIKLNMRLAHRIGNYGQLNSAEYIDALNKKGGALTGIEGPDGRYYISEITLVDAENRIYRVGFGEKTGNTIGPTIHTIEVSQDEMLADDQDEREILTNLPAFLRIGGHADVTPAAAAAVRAHRWWV